MWSRTLAGAQRINVAVFKSAGLTDPELVSYDETNCSYCKIFSNNVNLLLKLGKEDNACAKDNDRCFVHGHTHDTMNTKGQTHLSPCYVTSPTLHNVPSSTMRGLRRNALTMSFARQCTSQTLEGPSLSQSFKEDHHILNHQRSQDSNNDFQLINSRGLSPENRSGFLRIRLAGSRPLAADPFPC